MPNDDVQGLLESDPPFDFSGLGFQAGQRAVVTGAASGIGRSIAVLLARAGVSVFAWDLDEAGLASLATELAPGPSVVSCRRVDTCSEDEIAAAWRETEGLDIQFLANNAGPPSGTQMSVADGVRQAIGGYAAMTEQFLALHASAAESVVYTASIAGNFKVSTTPDWYPAAKAGICGYMRHIAVKHRGRPRANAVAPGVTVTARTAQFLAQPALREQFAAYPMGRAGQAWEVATVICFLLCPASSFVNGALVPVEGASTWGNAPGKDDR